MNDKPPAADSCCKVRLHAPHCAASAGGLTRGYFGPAPKSKSIAPQTRFTKKLKLYFLLGVEPPKKYEPVVGDDRSLSSPANVHVFSTTQFEPGCRFGPNSLSKTRS